MPARLLELGSERVLLFDAATPVADANGARTLIEEALGERATMIAVPAEALGDAFFDLKTGLAGELLQKAANYRQKFAVIGDVSSHVAASASFRDLVVEAERGASLYFAADVQALEQALSK